MTNDKEFAYRLYENFRRYREGSISHRRFKHADILPLIKRLKDKNIFNVYKAGLSTEGREIPLIKFGEGKTAVFLWSQMHGDESTATAAIFDILNFMSCNDEFNPCRNKFRKKLTIYFMPMVNPDGAELFRRENIINIDLNRDAAALQTDEAKVLMKTFKKIKAKFGFNLHDQSRTYSAGNTHKQATISFLAPPFNFNRDVSRTRSGAMKLIVKLNEILSWFIPGHVAKYSDEFEPRAFGDNFQRLGTSTILIESGSWCNDIEKQFVRKINFIALLSAFKCISEESYKSIQTKEYFKIPDNEERMMDLIIRNAGYIHNKKEYKLDIGINREEINVNLREFYFKSQVKAVGDLTGFYGYEDYDFDGMTIHPGKTFPRIYNSLNEIKELDFISLYKKGYTNIRLVTKKKLKVNRLPLNIILNDYKMASFDIKTNNNPNFYVEKDGKILYVIINGYLFNLLSLSGDIPNADIFR